MPALNLVSSPGAGKTLLLERTLQALGSTLTMAVVTGDVQTENDARRLACHTDALVQAVVTGGGCHLDARQILTALEEVDLNTGVLAWMRIGQIHDLMGRRDQARAAYRQAIALAPQADAARECRRYLSSPYQRRKTRG